MSYVVALIVIVLSFMGRPGHAGPWLRAPGSQFLSLSVEWGQEDTRPSAYGSIYYEYGLRPNLTLGLDAGRDSWGQSTALAFARIPLMVHDSGSRMAAEMAMGSYGNGSDTEFAIRPGLSWGRPLHFGQGGWLSLTATYDYVPKTKQALAKVEGTLGLNRGEQMKLLLQVTAEKPKKQDDLFTATPGVAWRIGQTSHLLGGVILRSDGSTALKLGLWREF
ncbi:hypothetical protein [Shimia sediminis]|uniref:hypothetical protein n=1 Tax=Shimia sediminis TaxID=2497945 RepID=UPI000F8DCC8D|nr:hypothetical protein [Shimia sediminis]